MNFDSGLALEVARQLRQRGVRGLQHLLAQQGQMLGSQSGRVATAVRLGREALPGAMLADETGYGPAADVEDVCHVIECACAAFVGEDDPLAQVGGISLHGL